MPFIFTATLRAATSSVLFFSGKLYRRLGSSYFRHHLFIFVVFVTSLRMLYLFIFVMSLLLHNIFISVLIVGDVGLDELLGRYALAWSTSQAAGDCLQEHLHGTCTTTQAQGIEPTTR